MVNPALRFRFLKKIEMKTSRLIILGLLGGLTLTMATSFSSCGKKTKSEVDILPDSVYLQRGDSISAATFDTLSKTLRYIMQTAGPDSAIRFCNVQAYPITKIYQSHGIHVKRTAAKFRNPANEPDLLENQLLNEFKDQHQAGKELKPIIRRDNNGGVHYFKPILLQGMCVTCHGDPAIDIPDLVKNVLSELYPSDQAIGYRIGDLRGLWHIQFDADLR